MRTSIFTSGVCATALLAAATGASTPPPTAATAYGKLFDSLRKTVGDNFYDPSFRGKDWERIGRKYRPRIGAVKTDAEFQALGHEMLAELGTSHLDILPPRAVSAGTVSIAAKMTSIDGKNVVTQVSPLSDARRQGLRVGDIIRSGVGSIAGPLGSTAILEAEACDGSVRTLRVKREDAFWPAEQPTFRWSTIAQGPGRKIGYLRVDGFGDDGAQLSDRAMADLGGASALVIDLRYNSGGNASALRLGSYFTEGAQPGLGLLMRDWLARLGRTARPADVLAAPKLTAAYTTDAVFKGLEAGSGAAMLWTEDLGEKRWKKPVVVLQGENTGSAAEGFAWLMRLKTQATLVGRDTAGALLGSQVKEIGSGWSVRIPVHGIWAPDGQDYGDRPVPPHVKVSWTRAHLCTGRDPDLEAALDHLAR